MRCKVLLLLSSTLAILPSATAASGPENPRSLGSIADEVAPSADHLSVAPEQEVQSDMTDRLPPENRAFSARQVLEELPIAEALKARLTRLRFKRWLYFDKPPEYVLSRFVPVLGDPSISPFDHPYINVWAEYMRQTHERAYESMYEELLEHYDDEILVDMLAKAATVEHTKKLAVKLQVVQLESWLSTYDDSRLLFRKLKLRGTMGKFPDRQKAFRRYQRFYVRPPLYNSGTS
ncbi:unnamed protein product [Hyaloperonospora brassicae]|uniref:RxLR effector candidate protein n=1 Tax=Hyaloperonospora brassicae TaxID=162125 RepID=A0AAV0UWV3_HYABA|nr:unnamed protein product [Hyaloperonospora brassicae]